MIRHRPENRLPKITALDRWPGDCAVRLEEDAYDSTGRRWIAGTVFGCQLASGCDNTQYGSPDYMELTAPGWQPNRAKFYGSPSYSPRPAIEPWRDAQQRGAPY